MWLSLSWCSVCLLSSWCVVCCLRGALFVCHHYGVTFICLKAIQMSKIYPINDNKSNQWSSIYCKTKIISVIVIIVILNVYAQLTNV